MQGHLRGRSYDLSMIGRKSTTFQQYLAFAWLSRLVSHGKSAPTRSTHPRRHVGALPGFETLRFGVDLSFRVGCWVMIAIFRAVWTIVATAFDVT